MSASELKDRLRADLKTAMRARNQGEVGVIRTLIAAIDNAEAQPIEHFEERLRRREVVGEVGRRELDSQALDAVLAAEIQSRVSAAEDYERNGRADDAARLRDEARLIGGYAGSAA
jgi:uncharacterized protein YqeY